MWCGQGEWGICDLLLQNKTKTKLLKSVHLKMAKYLLWCIRRYIPYLIWINHFLDVEYVCNYRPKNNYMNYQQHMETTTWVLECLTTCPTHLCVCLRKLTTHLIIQYSFYHFFMFKTNDVMFVHVLCITTMIKVMFHVIVNRL